MRQLVFGHEPSGRVSTIDVIRGLCIVSMVFAHVALGSIGYRATHAALWFDGAMGFVLLSGLVVGIVQRATIDRRTLAAGQLKLVKRARLVYLVHLGICVLAFVVASLSASRAELYPTVDSVGGWWQAIVATLTLQVNPTKAAILSLYVILLLIAVGASFLLRRKLWALYLGTSLALYVIGQLFNSQFTLPREPGAGGEINWATWQLMFFLAFLAGWHWKSVNRIIEKRSVWLASVVVTAVIIAGAYVDRFDDLARFVGPTIAWSFRSGTMGPGTILLAFAIIVAAYPVVGWVDKRIPPVTAVISRIGRRSLDCYVILCAFVLVVPTWVHYEASNIWANVYAASILLIMWTWCRFKDARGQAARTQTPAEMAHFNLG